MIKQKKNSDDGVSVLKWALIRFFIALASSLIAVGIFLAITKDEAKEGNQKASAALVTNKEVIDAIVKSCEDNGNPLREVVQSMLREDLEQSSDIALYEEFFPDADPEKLNEIIMKKERKTQRRLERIEPLNCRNQYPDQGGEG